MIKLTQTAQRHSNLLASVGQGHKQILLLQFQLITDAVMM
jgi:hypothetical protein